MKESVKTFLKDLLAVVLGIFITFTIQRLINRSADKKDVRSSLELVRSELVRNIDDISVMKDHLYQEIGSAEYFLSHKDSIGKCPVDSLNHHSGIIFADVSFTLSHDALELLKMSSIFQKIGDNDLSMKIIRAYDTCGSIVDYLNRHFAARDARFEKAIDKETAGVYASKGGIDIRKFIQTDYGNYAIQWLTAQSDPASFTDVADLKEAISAIDSYLK